MRAAAIAYVLALISAMAAGAEGISGTTYFCTADTRCFTDRKCENFVTRIYVTRQSERGRIEMRWPERHSPNVRHYAMVSNAPGMEMAGFLPSWEDGFGAATFQLHTDGQFLSAGISHGTNGGETQALGVTIQGRCTRIED